MLSNVKFGTAVVRPGVLLATAAMSIAFAATGCGSGAEESTVSSKVASAGVKKAEKLLADYSKSPSFTAPGPAFDATEVMTGKSIYSVPASTANPFCKTLIETFEEVAGKVGFPFQYWPNQGSTSEWVQGMQHGIATKPSLIELTGGSSPKLLKPQIKAAQAQGIKVTDSAINGITGEGGIAKSPYVDFTNGLPYKRAGELEAAWTIQDTGGDANVLVITSNDATSSPIVYSGIEHAFKTYCPNCKYDSVDVPLAEWSTKITPAVQGALAQEPDLNYIIPEFDSESPFVASALKTAGKTSQVKIATFNGTPEILDMVENGEVAMDAAQNLNWVGYAIMDNAMRLSGGMPAIADEHVPLQVVTEENVSTFNQGAYLEGYDKLWGLE